MRCVCFVRASVVLSSLLLAAANLATTSTARADQITYDIVNYPGAQADEVNVGQTDVVSGTITAETTGALGSYIAGSFNPPTDPLNVTLTYDITIANPADSLSFTYTGSNTLNAYLGSGTVEFTSSAVILNNGYLGLGFSEVGESTLLYWRSDIDSYMGYVTGVGGPVIEFSQSPATTLDPNPWTLAVVAVPEPGTLTLLGSALLALGLATVRRSGRKA